MASIFKSNTSTRPKPKVHISVGTLPPFINPTQPPTKKSPWRQILELPFTSSLTLTYHASSHDALLQAIMQQHRSASLSDDDSTSYSQAQHQAPTYAKVILSLSDILTKPFLDRYIKTGNILLVSEGTPGSSDWLGHLHDGTIRLEMSRDIYERCGLQGRPADRNAGARKHGRDRWVVELDLRTPAMVSGQKGFERLVKAAREVMNHGKVWLFKDLGVSDKGKAVEVNRAQNVIEEFYPTFVQVEPDIRDVTNVLVPRVISAPQHSSTSSQIEVLEDDYYELVEWLDLVRLGSPRILQSDNPDPHISRYAVPGVDSSSPTDLKVVTWTGLLDRAWVTHMLIDIIKKSRRVKSSQWLAMTMNTHPTEALGQIDGCTILLQPEAQDLKGADEMDMDTNLDYERVTENEEGALFGGFQQFSCFQFVDSVVS